jgi:hypothetical protein
MSFPKFIEIDGKRFAWCELLKLRRAQRRAIVTGEPVLFELKDDSRPACGLCARHGGDRRGPGERRAALAQAMACAPCIGTGHAPIAA